MNLANAARRLGAVFRFRQKVVAIPGDGRVSEVALASGERVAAEIVIIAQARGRRRLSKWPASQMKCTCAHDHFAKRFM